MARDAGEASWLSLSCRRTTASRRRRARRNEGFETRRAAFTVCRKRHRSSDGRLSTPTSSSLAPASFAELDWLQRTPPPWGAALELAEGLPPAARMEMALPPALSVLARALSRRATVLGFATRDKPWHLVGVAFREGRASDVITAVKDRVVIGPHGQSRPSTRGDARTHLHEWLVPYGVSPTAIEIVLGDRDLASTWR